MKKKTIIFILILAFIILITYKFLNKHNKINFIIENSIETSSTTNIENIVTTKDVSKEIQIYDIEDGYLTVPYNEKANKHIYDWNNLSNDSNGYYIYNDDLYQSKLGIDVSKHQGNIDWKKVKASGIEFAIIRLGFRGYGKEGKLVLDSTFEKNVQEATNEGINVGIYFFSQAINEAEAIEEANYVLEEIKDKTIAYPICFDLEKIKFDTSRTDNLTTDDITKITHAFCKEIEKAGYVPAIYGNSKTFTTRMYLEQFNNYQKWYADYQETPLYPYDFSIWQYSEQGIVDGISTNVDLNIHFIPKE